MPPNIIDVLLEVLHFSGPWGNILLSWQYLILHYFKRRGDGRSFEIPIFFEIDIFFEHLSYENECLFNKSFSETQGYFSIPDLLERDREIYEAEIM